MGGRKAWTRLGQDKRINQIPILSICCCRRGEHPLLLRQQAKANESFIPDGSHLVLGVDKNFEFSKHLFTKKCVVVADVKHDALDADNITFNVSSVELINTAAAPSTSSSRLPLNPTATNETCTLIDPPEDMPNQSEGDKNSESRLTKDIIGMIDPNLGEDTSSTA